MNSQEFAAQIIALTQTLYRVAYTQLPQKSDREDAVQETLKRAWEKRRQLKRPEYLQTWLIRILLNVCHDMQKHNKHILPKEAVPAASRERPPELREALWALEEKYRLPILLHYIEGCSVSQTADILRLPQGTVKTRLRMGREKLKDLLREEVFDP